MRFTCSEDPYDQLSVSSCPDDGVTLTFVHADCRVGAPCDLCGSYVTLDGEELAKLLAVLTDVSNGS